MLLTAFINMNEVVEPPPPPYDGFKERAAELLRILASQIDKRKILPQSFTVCSLPLYLTLQISAETKQYLNEN